MLIGQIIFLMNFTPNDLITMLDEDGTKDVNEQEVVQGLLRLVYCNDFQHTCLVKVSLNEILKT